MALHCAKEIFRSMKTATILAIMLCATATAYADFSYTVAQKTQGSPAAAGPSSTRVLYKGQKMMMDRGAEATVVDFDAQTITTLNKTQKTWSVRKFSELGQGLKQVDTDATIIDRGAEATVVDFDAQTITTLNKTQKTWSVRKFSELGQGLKQVDTDAKI